MPYLPGSLHYRILFSWAERDLDEVLVSQEKMLESLQAGTGKVAGYTPRDMYAKQLRQVKTMIDQNPLAEMITVLHRDAVKNHNMRSANAVARFLGITPT